MAMQRSSSDRLSIRTACSPYPSRRKLSSDDEVAVAIGFGASHRSPMGLKDSDELGSFISCLDSSDTRTSATRYMTEGSHRGRPLLPMDRMRSNISSHSSTALFSSSLRCFLTNLDAVSSVCPTARVPTSEKWMVVSKHIRLCMIIAALIIGSSSASMVLQHRSESSFHR